MHDDLVWIVAAVALIFAAFLISQPSAPREPIHAGSTSTPVIYVGAH